jgi:hypothetical protein
MLGTGIHHARQAEIPRCANGHGRPWVGRIRNRVQIQYDLCRCDLYSLQTLFAVFQKQSMKLDELHK